jgi:hypothetical protein
MTADAAHGAAVAEAPAFEDATRQAVATAMVQGGFDDWTECCEYRSECECPTPFTWHRCGDCDHADRPCACAGVPWINDETWQRMYPWVTSALATVAVETLTPLIEADLRERIAADIEVACLAAVHSRTVSPGGSGPSEPGLCIRCGRAARLVREAAEVTG